MWSQLDEKQKKNKLGQGKLTVTSDDLELFCEDFAAVTIAAVLSHHYHFHRLTVKKKQMSVMHTRFLFLFQLLLTFQNRNNRGRRTDSITSKSVVEKPPKAGDFNSFKYAQAGSVAVM